MQWVLLFADYSVALDTGSSDLWVRVPPQKILNDSGIFAHLEYGSGAIKGPIQFAELTIGEYVIPSQGMCHVSRAVLPLDVY